MMIKPNNLTCIEKILDYSTNDRGWIVDKSKYGYIFLKGTFKSIKSIFIDITYCITPL